MNNYGFIGVRYIKEIEEADQRLHAAISAHTSQSPHRLVANLEALTRIVNATDDLVKLAEWREVLAKLDTQPKQTWWQRLKARFAVSR